MRFNIPLLPLQVEIRWRPLPALQFRIWHWMSVVGIVGLFSSAMNYLARLGARNQYHARQVILDPANRAMHMAESNRFAEAIRFVDGWLALVFLLMLTLTLIWVLGRLLNRISRNAQPR